MSIQYRLLRPTEEDAAVNLQCQKASLSGARRRCSAAWWPSQSPGRSLARRGAA
jgi:hypothetical protein